MLEELFWEHAYSGYGFYDYMALRNGSASLSAHLGRSTALGVQFYDLTLGLGLPPRVTKDLSLSGSGYGNSIQMENYTSSPSTVATRSYFLFPIHLELTESGDAFATSKLLPSASSKLSAVSLFASTSTFGSRSYASVFDSFRSDFSCFDWYLAATYPSTPAVGADGTALGSSLRVTNPVTLRASVRNSIVNYSAFQKVFKARLDEGRAHVRATSFADLSMTQPFISDTKVPYTRILGKDRTSFFETPLHSASPHAS